MTLAACAVWAALLGQPRRAEALSCAAPPSHVVIYPAKGATLPRDGVVYLYSRGGRTRDVMLVDAKAVRTIKGVDFHWSAGLKLLRITPRKPLPAGRRFQVYVGKRAISDFRTSAASLGRSAPPPRITAGRAVFSAPNRRNPWMTRGVRHGTVALVAKGKTAPVVVGVVTRFRKGRSWGHTHRFAVRFNNKLAFAPRQLCHFIGGPAPERGRYEVKLTPFAANGKRGPTIIKRGKIR